MSFLVYEKDERKEKKLVRILKQLSRERGEDIPIYCVKNKEEALHMLETEKIEAAFISWEDPWGHGLFLAGALLKKERRVNVIAMSQETKHMREVWKWHVSGYITGKVTREKVQEELDNLRNSPYWEKEYDYSFYEQ